MLLLIDIGNTRVKAALSDGSDLHAVSAHLHQQNWADTFNAIATQLDQPVSEIYVASVMSPQNNQLIEQTIKACFKLTPNFLKTQKFQCGLENAYTTPDDMGVDRWLSMLGAWQQTQAACMVISCGTALTMDLVNAKGQHVGGYIIPGMRLMRESLHKGTQKVKSEPVDPPDWQWGSSTQQCVDAGALLTTVSAIDRAIVNAEIKCAGKVVCFISGGDAATIQTYLQHTVKTEPNLVFQGILNVYAEAKKGC